MKKTWLDLTTRDEVRMMERILSRLYRVSPDETSAIVVLVGPGGTTVHASDMHPLEEAAGLRELADRIEADAIESN